MAPYGCICTPCLRNDVLRHPFDLAYQGFALKNRVPMDISEATRVSPTLHNGAVTPLGGGLTLSPLKFASWGRQGKDVCVGRGGGGLGIFLFGETSFVCQ